MNFRSSRTHTPTSAVLSDQTSMEPADELTGYHGGSLAIHRPSLLLSDASAPRVRPHHGLWGE